MTTKPFTLADIHDAAEKKYGAFPIELEEGKTLELVNPLRLSKSERNLLSTLSDKEDDEDEGKEEDEDAAVERLREIIRVAARGSELVEDLFTALGDDIALLMAVIEAYFDRTQVGEASPSQG